MGEFELYDLEECDDKSDVDMLKHYKNGSGVSTCPPGVR